MHGYALAFHFVFATHTLDDRNWCLDFGGLKPVRAWLHEQFDHTVLVAADDPHFAEFQRLEELGLVDIRVLPAVGCEAIAAYAFAYVAQFVATETNRRVWLESVEVREHAGNSAIYQEAPPGRKCSVGRGSHVPPNPIAAWPRSSRRNARYG